VLQKEDNDWLKKCMEYEVEGARPRGRPKKTWSEMVEKDCHACKFNREDAWIVIDGGGRRGMTDDHDRCVFFSQHTPIPTQPVLLNNKHNKLKTRFGHLLQCPAWKWSRLNLDSKR